jgi:translation initiation factor 1 (eIF-1/SUI1)
VNDESSDANSDDDMIDTAARAAAAAKPKKTTGKPGSQTVQITERKVRNSKMVTTAKGLALFAVPLDDSLRSTLAKLFSTSVTIAESSIPTEGLQLSIQGACGRQLRDWLIATYKIPPGKIAIPNIKAKK